MTNLERVTGLNVADSSLYSLAKDLETYLKPLGLPQGAAIPLVSCLESIHGSGIVKAIVLELKQTAADADSEVIVFPPTLEFSVYLTEPQQLLDDRQAEIIEDIGSSHDRFADFVDKLSASTPIATTIHILNPDRYPRTPDDFIGTFSRRKTLAQLEFRDNVSGNARRLKTPNA